MSADTFVSALFIITAVVAAGILINAVYPIVWTSASTFSSSAHETDTRMRTDFKIVNIYAKGTSAQFFIKNIGTTSLGDSEIQSADVYVITPEGLVNPPYNTGAVTPNWVYVVKNPGNSFWDNGETLEIGINMSGSFNAANTYTFQFVLPNGVQRSAEFSPST